MEGECIVLGGVACNVEIAVGSAYLGIVAEGEKDDV